MIISFSEVQVKLWSYLWSCWTCCCDPAAPNQWGTNTTVSSLKDVVSHLNSVGFRLVCVSQVMSPPTSSPGVKPGQQNKHHLTICNKLLIKASFWVRLREAAHAYLVFCSNQLKRIFAEEFNPHVDFSSYLMLYVNLENYVGERTQARQCLLRLSKEKEGVHVWESIVMRQWVTVLMFVVWHSFLALSQKKKKQSIT